MGDDVLHAGFTNNDGLFESRGTSIANPANWLLDQLLPQLPAASLPISLAGEGWTKAATLLDGIGETILRDVGGIATNLQNLFEHKSQQGFFDTPLDAAFDTFE